MRQAATLFIFGFVLLLIFLIYLTKSLAVVQRIAVIDSVVGSAVLLHGENPPIPLEVGRLVRTGDIVRVGPDSSVELRWARWAGGMRIKLGPDTNFTVARATVNRSTGEEESRLHVEKGTVWIRLRRAITGKSKFEVEMPTAVAAVRGTVFQVSVDESGISYVSVWDGAVAVKTKSGAEFTVSGGASTQIDPGVEPREPRLLSPTETAEWEQQTSIIGPFLAVETPTDGETFSTPECIVSGRAEPESEVLIDGAPVPLSDKGRFSKMLDLDEGERVIYITARAPDQTETIIQRRIAVTFAQPVSP